MDGVGELEPIHAAGHLDIRKQQLNVGAGFEDRKRIVGIDGFNSRKPGVLDHIHRAHAKQHFIFDNKNGAKNGRLTWSHCRLALSP